MPTQHESKKNIQKAERDAHCKALRNRFYMQGADSFEDHELLDLLMSYALPNRDTETLARDMLARFGSLKAVTEASAADIKKLHDLDDSAAILPGLVQPIARHIKTPATPYIFLTSVQLAGEYAVTLLAGERLEHLYVIVLDEDKRLLAASHVGAGTLDEMAVYPRQVVAKVLQYGGTYAILAHNHPTGLLSASASDLAATTIITKALSEADIKVLDHIIVGDGRFYSFAEKRLLATPGE